MGRAKSGMEDDRLIAYDCKMLPSFDEGKVKLSHNLPAETSFADSEVERSIRDLNQNVTRANSEIILNGEESESEVQRQWVDEEEEEQEEVRSCEEDTERYSSGGERRRRVTAVEILNRNFGTTSKSHPLNLNNNSQVQYNVDNQNDEEENANNGLTAVQRAECGDCQKSNRETGEEEMKNEQSLYHPGGLSDAEFLTDSGECYYNCDVIDGKPTSDEEHFRVKEHVYCTVYCIANDGYGKDVESAGRSDETPKAPLSDAQEGELETSRSSESLSEPYGLGDLVDPWALNPPSPEHGGVGAEVLSCRVCLEDKAIAALHCCQKAVCDECLKLYVSSQVRVGRAYIICPIPECSGFLEEGLVLSHLANEEVAKYHYFLELSQLDASTKPCPQCSQFTSLRTHTPNRTEHKYKIQCSKCQFVWCFKCHAPWHNGLKCRDYRRGDKLLRNWASVIEHGQRNAQKCPQCKIHIQRTDGCDHMTCTQCNTNFCYRCGERYRHLRFFGDHTSNLSVFGCKYRYLPDKPHLRRLIRGSVCVTKVVIAPVVIVLVVVLGALSLVIGLVVFPVYYACKRKRKQHTQGSGRWI
ncbi:E3 ubiquitin-protein ligase RNF217 [Polymixia lowei]